MSVLECATPGCKRRKVGIAKLCSACLSGVNRENTALATIDEDQGLKKSKITNILDTSLLAGAFTGGLSLWLLSRGTKALAETAAQKALSPTEPDESALTKPLPQKSLDDRIALTADEYERRELMSQVTKKELAEAYMRLKRRSRDRRKYDRREERQLARRTAEALEKLSERMDDAAEPAPAVSSSLGEPMQMMGASVEIAAGVDGALSISPQVSPYFKPKAIALYGIDPYAVGTNQRFYIKSVEIGGVSQLATTDFGYRSDECGILSDAFYEPVPVDWSVFSTQGLARELQIKIHNPNSANLKVFAVVYGDSMDSLPTTNPRPELGW